MDDYHIELSLDWGTFKWVAAYAICQNGKRRASPALVLISDTTYEVRMMAAWVNGDLVQGDALELTANDDKNLSDMVVDHFKLCLYEGPEVAHITARVQGILEGIPGGKTLDMLIAEHLKSVIKDVKEGIRNSDERFYFTPEDLDDMLERMRIRITVPQMWTPSARRRMQQAAKAAGLQIVVLAHEPRCALAYLIDKISRKKFSIDRTLVRGNLILVADLGSGTGDFVLYKLLENLSSSSRLKPIGQGSGEICGSFRVDELLYKALIKRKGREWLLKCVDELSVTERDFERRALEAIEKIKRDFTKSSTIGTGTIRGIGPRYVSFELTRKEIISALDQLIATIITTIDKLTSGRKPDVIQLTGGFSKSWYLVEKLREKYENGLTVVVRPTVTDALDSFPVAVGALYRYDNIIPQNLPSKYGYALLQREAFFEELHKDSRTVKRDAAGKRVVTPKRWVKTSPYDKTEDVVDDRILNIVPKGTILKPGQVCKQSFSQEYFSPMENPRITAEFVYLTKKFADGDASREHEDEPEDIDDDEEGTDRRRFRDGVNPWAAIQIPLTEFQSKLKGFETVEGDQKEKFYKLRARVFIQALPEDLQIGFEVLKPVFRPSQPAGKGDGDEDGHSEDEFDGETVFEVMEPIWEGVYSEFAKV